jgi:hypothetical protein
VEDLMNNADSGMAAPVNINNKPCLEALNLILTENMIPGIVGFVEEEYEATLKAYPKYNLLHSQMIEFALSKYLYSLSEKLLT